MNGLYASARDLAGGRGGTPRIERERGSGLTSIAELPCES